MDIELRHMRAFVALAEERHFGRAAEKLHITQPPLSRQIQDLERELGTELVDRSRRPMRLTPAGRVFLEQARLTLEQARRGVDRSRRAGDGRVTWLRVAALSSAFDGCFPNILRAFRRRYPDVAVETSTTRVDLQADSLRDETFDIAITQWIRDSNGLKVEPLTQERRIALVPAEHPFAGRSALALAELAGQPFISPCPVCTPELEQEQAALFTSYNLTRTVAHQACGPLQQLGLVAAAEGVALAIDSIANVRRGGVTAVPLDQAVPGAEFFLLWRQADQREQVTAFLDVAREVAGRVTS